MPGGGTPERRDPGGGAEPPAGAHAAPAGPGTGAPGPGGPDGPGVGGPAGDHPGLVPADRARGYQDRWNALKGDFVDEPRAAVGSANALVGEVLDEIEATFRRQREQIEHDLDSQGASTEELRLALNRYRSFFERLLSM